MRCFLAESNLASFGIFTDVLTRLREGRCRRAGERYNRTIARLSMEIADASIPCSSRHCFSVCLDHPRQGGSLPLVRGGHRTVRRDELLFPDLGAVQGGGIWRRRLLHPEPVLHGFGCAKRAPHQTPVTRRKPSAISGAWLRRPGWSGRNTSSRRCRR